MVILPATTVILVVSRSRNADGQKPTQSRPSLTNVTAIQELP
jgi:hypothetical protein